MKKYLFMVTTTLALTIQIQSQTIINAGPVSGTWTASGSPYHIMGDIEVPAGNALVVEPGVTIKFFNEVSFKIYGNLKAIGSQSNQILFTLGATYCKGIQILNAEDTCKFVYCKFMNFKNKSEIETGKIKGGAIYASNSNIEISNSYFNNNWIQIDSYSPANAYGGAICFDGCLGKIYNSQLVGNQISGECYYGSSYGGAIYSNNSDNLLIENNVIQNNKIDRENDGDEYAECYARGGALFITGGTISNNLIQNNSCIAIADAASLYMDAEAHAFSEGGGIYGLGSILINNLISGNTCHANGIAWSLYGTTYGSASAGGGGVYGGVLLKNNLINNNTSEAFAFDYSCSSGGGVHSGINLINNTVILNQVEASGYNSITFGSGIVGAYIINCIIYYNTGAAYQISATNTTYSCIQGGYSGQGNISSDPLFVNSAAGNYHLKQPPCQSQLSPCVDAGDPLTSLFMGTTRTDQVCDTSVIDMGYHYPCEFYGPTLIAKFHALNPTLKSNCPAYFVSDCIEFLVEITEWKWDFQNDGIIDSEEENPDFTYNEVGNYSVKLIINGQEQTGAPVSDTLLKENYIHVCHFAGGFYQDTALGWYPLTVQFTDTSDVINTAISDWRWDFNNDGLIESTEQNPEYIFVNPGLFAVKQIIVDTSGYVRDTTIKEDLIMVKQFDANFIADKTYGELPLTVNYSNTSEAYGTEITGYEWDFENDGIIDSYEESPTMTYSETGNYSVKLILTGLDAGEILTDSLLKENYIHLCYFESGFDQDTTSGFYPLTVYFTDTSEVINTTISSWRWDFDNDGIIESNEQNPEFVYEELGLYTVKFMVTDSSGYIVDTTIKYDLINANGIMAGFEAFPVLGYVPLSVNFSSTSLSHNAEITGWEWDFQNDGITDSYEENPIWIYSEAAFYSVKLIVTGESTKELVTDTVIKENFVAAVNILAEFHSDKNYGHFPLQVHFYDDSYSYPVNYGQNNSWQWDFQNDGIIDSYLQNPLWTFSEPGIFSVKLIAGNSNYMAYDTILKTDLITICRMVPEFYAEPLSGDVPLEVNFFDTSFVENTQISTWKWDFQHDGLIDAYGPNPSWTYPEADIYSVELRITDTSGQIWKSVVKEGYITVNPITGISYQSKENHGNKFEIYPNPFTKDLIIEIKFDKSNIVTIQIFDVAFNPVATIAKNDAVNVGKEIWKWENLNNDITPGIYYISLTISSGKHYIKKCIKVD